MLNINRTDITVMQILKSKSADNAAFGMTISELMDEMQEIGSKSRMTVYRRLRKLSESGYVGKGVLENHSDTFYLLEKGDKALKGDVKIISFLEFKTKTIQLLLAITLILVL